MEANRRSFNQRAFTAVVSGLTALPLPFTGLALHGFSEGVLTGDKHIWLMLHVVCGVLFAVFASWHALINRRALLQYVKSVFSGRS